MVPTLSLALPTAALLGFVLLTAVLLLLAEWGYRAGRGRREDGEKRKSQIGTLQGAMLGMLGLLLGFSFAMAVDRFETRRKLMVDEANAIGTAWLRAAFLPADDMGTARNELQRYVDMRLKLGDPAVDRQEQAELLAGCEACQSVLWRMAVRQGRENPNPLVALYASALNELIDLDASRQAAIAHHVPGTVWVLLVLVSGLACWVTGHATALGGTSRLLLPMFVLPALLSVLITLVYDIDHPREGLIRLSVQSLEATKAAFERHR